jgi:DNA-binding transcriptional LysR family regulator
MEMLRQSRLDVVISCKTQNMTGIDSIKLYEEIPCLASNSDGNTKIVFLPYEELWKEIDPSDGNTMRVNSLNAAIELAKAKIGTTLIPYPMAVKHGFANINPIRHKRVPMYFCTEKFTKTPGQITAFLKRLRDWKN